MITCPLPMLIPNKLSTCAKITAGYNSANFKHTHLKNDTVQQRTICNKIQMQIKYPRSPFTFHVFGMANQVPEVAHHPGHPSGSTPVWQLCGNWLMAQSLTLVFLWSPSRGVSGQETLSATAAQLILRTVPPFSRLWNKIMAHLWGFTNYWEDLEHLPSKACVSAYSPSGHLQ